MKEEGKVEVGLNYDSVLEYLGQFGCFQKKVFLWMCLISFLTGPPIVVFAFTGEGWTGVLCVNFVLRISAQLQMSHYLVW